jgi:hypothetical protein
VTLPDAHVGYDNCLQVGVILGVSLRNERAGIDE